MFDSTELYLWLVQITGETDWTVAWNREEGYTAWTKTVRLTRHRTKELAMSKWSEELKAK